MGSFLRLRTKLARPQASHSDGDGGSRSRPGVEASLSPSAQIPTAKGSFGLWPGRSRVPRREEMLRRRLIQSFRGVLMTRTCRRAGALPFAGLVIAGLVIVGT